jgi:hypothetical protein
MAAELSVDGQDAYLEPDPGWRHDGGLPDFPGPWQPVHLCSGCGTVYTGGTHTCQSGLRHAVRRLVARAGSELVLS